MGEPDPFLAGQKRTEKPPAPAPAADAASCRRRPCGCCVFQAENPRPTLCLSGEEPAAAFFGRRACRCPAGCAAGLRPISKERRAMQRQKLSAGLCHRGVPFVAACRRRHRCVFQARESSRRCFPYGSLRGAGVPRRGDSRLCMRGARLRAGRIGRSAPPKGSTPWRRSVSRGAAFRVGEEQAGACVR